MKFKAPIYPQVWLVFILWVAIILAIGRWLAAGQKTDVLSGLQSGVRPNVIVAMLFGLGCIGFWKIWKETGFTGIAKNASWWLLIVPVAFIVTFAAFGLTQSNLATSAILIILVNSLFVGINEEVMLRGLVFSGMSDRFTFGIACIITTVLFGSMHMLNFFSTGELHILQSITTIGTGLMLLAIRVGMGSIIPAIIVHWLWDFSTAMTGSAAEISGGTLVQMVPLGILAAPILFAIIGGVYLWRYSLRLSREEAA